MRVTVYTKPVCQGCKATKRKLNDLDIDHDTVELSPEDTQRFLEMDLKSAPVVEVDLGEGAYWHWAGYAPSQIEVLDHAFGCDNPDCVRCESMIPAAV